MSKQKRGPMVRCVDCGKELQDGVVGMEGKSRGRMMCCGPPEDGRGFHGQWSCHCLQCYLARSGGRLPAKSYQQEGVRQDKIGKQAEARDRIRERMAAEGEPRWWDAGTSQEAEVESAGEGVEEEEDDEL